MGIRRSDVSMGPQIVCLLERCSKFCGCVRSRSLISPSVGLCNVPGGCRCVCPSGGENGGMVLCPRG